MQHSTAKHLSHKGHKHLASLLDYRRDISSVHRTSTFTSKQKQCFNFATGLVVEQSAPPHVESPNLSL